MKYLKFSYAGTMLMSKLELIKDNTTDGQDHVLHVGVLHKSLTPYRIPFFQSLSKSKRHHFDFFFTSSAFDGHPWKFEKNLGFNYQILPSKDNHSKKSPLYFLKDFPMISQKYDLVILGDHLNAPQLVSYLNARFKKIPILRWIPETKNSVEGMPRIKAKVKRFINRMSDGVLVPGSAGKEYIAETTKRTGHIYPVYNVVNNELFRKARTIPKSTSEELKRKYKLKGTVISFFGRLIGRKGIDVLLNAVDLVNTREEFSLMLVGEGPLREEILRRKDNSRVPIHLIDYVAPEDLPKYYAISDITVLPSYIDTWGMVINESMVAGVPVICSTGAGAAMDLVKHNTSGLVFEKGNAQDLASAIEVMLSNEQFRCNLIKEADKIIENYTIEKARDQFLDAVDRTYERMKQKIS